MSQSANASFAIHYQSLRTDLVNFIKHRLVRLETVGQELSIFQHFYHERQINGLRRKSDVQESTLQNLTLNRQCNTMSTNMVDMNNQSCAQMNSVQSPGMLATNGSYGRSNGTIIRPSNIMQNQGSVQPNVYDLVQQMSLQLNTRLAGIEQNMNKLSMIESSISSVKTEITNLKSDNVVLRSNLSEMDSFCQSVSDFVDDCNRHKSSTNSYIKQLEQENKSLRTDYNEIKDANKNLLSTVSALKEKILEIESRSMRSNLLFFGIDECEENLRDRSYREDSEKLLKDFMKSEMTFEEADSINPDEIKFDRVHRLGRPKFHQSGRLLRPRPIVAAFAGFKERECVRRAVSTVQNRKYSVREQFPSEIEERRKVLYPVLKSAKSNPSNVVKLVRDKLIINGTAYTHTDIQGSENKEDDSRNHDIRSVPRTTSKKDSEWCLRRIAKPQLKRDSGAIPKLNFHSQNTYTPLTGLGGDETFNWRGKKKAVSPLEEQSSPKKARDVTPGSPSDGAVVYDSDSDSQPKIVSDNTQQNASATAIHNTSSLPKVSSDPVINNGTESNEQLMDT